MVPLFLTFSLSLFWGKVLNFIMLLYLVIIEVIVGKISFSKLMPMQSYGGKPLGVGSTYPSLGIRKVKCKYKTNKVKILILLRCLTKNRSLIKGKYVVHCSQGDTLSTLF